MSRQHESHVSEWASLLGERVPEEALDSARSDGRSERVERPSGG